MDATSAFGAAGECVENSLTQDLDWTKHILVENILKMHTKLQST